jgi:hypothetical protein
MTEADWLVATDPRPMLAFLVNEASDRKLRLFACANCRRMEELMDDDRLRDAVDVAERYADGLARERERAAAAENVNATNWITYLSAPAVRALQRDATLAATEVSALSTDYAVDARKPPPAEAAAQVGLLRCIFGNPFRPFAPGRSWLTSTVRTLAEGIYADRAFDRVPILADALQDAGCNHPDMLAHCRGTGPHARGCWVVDLILGKD